MPAPQPPCTAGCLRNCAHLVHPARPWMSYVMTRCRATVLAASTFAAVWCGAGCNSDEPAAAGTVVRDSAGVTLAIVEPARPPDVTLSIDESWAPSAGDLGDVRDVAALEDGRVAVLDGFDGTVTLLAPDGSIEARFGGAGEGPGEFSPQGLTAILWTGSSFLVPDLLQQRVTEFSETGELVRVWPGPEGGMYGVDWRVLDDGRVLLRDVKEGADPVLRWSDGVVDTLLLLEHEEPRPNTVLGMVPVWDVLGDVVAEGRSDEWFVSLAPPGDSRPMIVARSTDASPPLSDVERESLLRTLAATVVQNSNGALGADEAIERLRLQISFPERRPEIVQLRFDASGRLWIQIAAPVAELGPDAFRVGTSTGYGGRDWVVLAPDGRSSSVVRFPGGFAPTRWMDEWVYGVLTTELGVETPARVRRTSDVGRAR